MANDQLLGAAARIADGEMLDWGSITSTLNSDHEREIAEELALVQQIAAGHRQLHQLLPVATDTPPHLMPDRARWGHLDLLNVVGRGSYGMVYRAWDTRLERLVALKLFHGASNPDAVMQEGRMLARVRHENVVTVYGADVFDGVAGIWMELIHGQTLDTIVKKSGPLPPTEAALVGADVARALGAVHAAGLLHCDVKAQNVVRENGGRVVLMDLGAGRLAPEARDSDQLSDVAGTPRYMAPELFVSGAEATKASDIYSLGVLIYYLLSGRFPVDGKTLGELKRAHEQGKARSLKSVRSDVPKGLLEIVTRSIDPDPQSRPATTADMQAALARVAIETPGPQSRARSVRWILAAVALVVLTAASLGPLLRPSSAVRSIAVLPIKNLTGDPSKAYVADGLTEVLISNLARIRSLRVPSSVLVAPFRERSDSHAEAAKSLGVELLLAGSVAEAGERIRIAVTLIDKDGNAIWGEELTREPSALLSAQAEIARMISTRLALTLSPVEAAGLEGAQRLMSPEASDAYLRALAMRRLAPSGQAEAASLFRRVVEIEPQFGRAWADLGEVELISYIADPNFGDRARRAKDIVELANRAIELDPNVGGAFTIRGTIEFYENWNFVEAEKTLRHGIEIDPNDGSARQRLSMLLAALGRLDEAIALGVENQQRQPSDPFRSTNLGMLYYYARNFDAAEVEMRRALRIQPDFASGFFMLGRVLAAEGRAAEASVAMRTAIQAARSSSWMSEYARVLWSAGFSRDAQAALDQVSALEHRGLAAFPDQAAHLAVVKGDLTGALEILTRAVDERSINVLWLLVDPRVDPLRSDPRFDALLSRIGVRKP